MYKNMISILLAVYNGEKYLAETMRSVLSQTYGNFELLIGLNGCTDGTADIVNSFKDERIKMFNYGDDKGKAKTLNKMLSVATGEWIAVQDADDVWAPIKLAEQVVHVGEYDVIGSRCMYINAGGTVTGQPNIALDHVQITGKCMVGDNQVINSSALIRATELRAEGGWDTSIDGVEDFDLWLRLIKRGCKFINVKKPLVFHRLHASSNFNTQQQDITPLLQKYNS